MLENADHKTRNPPWTREEIILALDAYFKADIRSVSVDANTVVQLSDTLQKLNAYGKTERLSTYRNPNSVQMKLMNFYGIEHPGRGLSNASKQDRSIYDEFVSDKSLLESIASRIKEAINSNINVEIINSGIDDEGFIEGALLEKQHKYRERNSKAVSEKKKQVLEKTGHLKCDACDFMFKEKYGSVGEDYIECHHILPISEVRIKQRTKLKDLALVCSNCHRMLHRKRPWLTIEQLRKIIQNQ